jgi:hypothetical protein
MPSVILGTEYFTTETGQRFTMVFSSAATFAPSEREWVGERYRVGPWLRADLAIDLTNDPLKLYASGGDQTVYPCGAQIRLRGYSALLNAAITAGTLTIVPLLGGVAVTAPEYQLVCTSAANSTGKTILVNSDVAQFADFPARIGFQVTTDHTFAPTTTDLQVIAIYDVVNYVVG